MKTQLLTALVCLYLSTSALALDQVKIAQFKSKLEAALKAQDFAALNRLYYTGDADPYRMAVISSGAQFKDNLADNTFDSLEILPLDDPKLSAENVRFYTQGEVQNGRHYEPNLQPVAVCKVAFKPGRKSYSSTSTSAVGIDPDGNIKFVLEKYAGGTPIFSVGQTKIDAFKAAVGAAMKSKDLNAIGFLFCTKEVSQSQMDTEIGGFESSLTTNAFDSVKIQAFDDPSLYGPTINREAIEPPAEGKATPGGGFPNLKPVLLCTINFKAKEHESVFNRVMWVGIDPEGQYKFVINTPEKVLSCIRD